MEVRAILEYMRENRPAIVELIRSLVAIESPTHEKAAVDQVADKVAEAVSGMAEVTRYSQADHGDHLRIEFDIPTLGDGQVLGLGHVDTVWELGTLERMPWRESDGRLWGPGVFDMKAGVAFMIFAARAIRDLRLQCRRCFVLQLNSDEEIGSPSSTQYTETEALRSAAVLVAEPSAGLEGNLKTARKGGATYRVEAQGVASHAGLEFSAGSSAIVELAGQIQRIAAWTDVDNGLTVNPGLVRGGTASNVVAERAWTDVDVRFPTKRQAEEIADRFDAIRADNPRCSVRVSGGVRKLPMERTDGVIRLFRLAEEISAEMGVPLGEASVGGGSDGNTTAALGIPTLDGLGAVGEGAHALHESILTDRIADRAALIAGLIHRL